VTNGGFDTDSDWIKGSSWSVSSGVATTDGTVIGAVIKQELTNTDIGDLLYIEYTVSNWNGSGSHKALLGSTAGKENTGNGTFYDAIVQNGDKEINIQTLGNAAFDVDNISVKEVTFDQGDLTLFNHPAGIPRIEYDANGNVLGLLVEEQRTNLVTYSEDFETWGKVSLDTGLDPVVTVNNAVAPDGNLTADKVVFDLGAGASARSYLASTILGTIAGDYTLTFWMKGEAGGEQIVARHVDAVDYSLFTLTTEWQRYTLTETGSGGTATVHIGLRQGVVGTINTQATVHIWGVQLEAGAFPTSYIPTSGSTATRSADVASIPVSAFGYNQSEGTVVVQCSMADPSVNPYQRHSLTINDGTGNNQIRFYNYNSNSSSFVVTDSATTQAALISGVTDSSSVAAGASFKQNNFVALFNGGAASTDSAGNLPSGLTVMLIGSAQGGSNSFLGGHIKSIKYFPRRLTNSQLQELTS
jgi:hypothetical protein